MTDPIHSLSPWSVLLGPWIKKTKTWIKKNWNPPPNPEEGVNMGECTLNLLDHSGEALRFAAHTTIWSTCPHCRKKSNEWRACDACLSTLAGLGTSTVECKACGFQDKWSRFHDVVRDRQA